MTQGRAAGIVLAQCLIVLASSAALTFVIGRARYSSPINLIWMVGLPIAIAFAFNRGLTRRVVIAAGLVLLSLIEIIALADRAGLGPS